MLSFGVTSLERGVGLAVDVAYQFRSITMGPSLTRIQFPPFSSH